jgi:hypothetical protein
VKFFITSPWRNSDAVKSLTEALRTRGHAAYSFLDNGANPATGRSVMEEFKEFGHSMVDWQDDPLIGNIFDAEMQALQDSDTVVLLEPAGRSSLTEAGIAYGMGKKVVLIGLVEHPEVVYRIFGRRYPNTDAFLADISLPGNP